MITASSLASLVLALLPPERAVMLPPELRAAEPTLLLPIFTRCIGTCPLTAIQLKGAPFRVILFSFDEADTDADLRDFRERFALPKEWLTVRSTDPVATRKLLDSLDFHVRRTDDGFDHPNATFVFSPAGRWAATLTGTSFDLQTARERAVTADSPSVRQWLIRPEAWVVLACIGLAGSLAIVLAISSRGASSGAASPGPPPPPGFDRSSSPDT